MDKLHTCDISSMQHLIQFKVFLSPTLSKVTIFRTTCEKAFIFGALIPSRVFCDSVVSKPWGGAGGQNLGHLQTVLQ